MVLACGGRFTAKERERIAGAARFRACSWKRPSVPGAGCPRWRPRSPSAASAGCCWPGSPRRGRAELLQALARQAGLPAAAVAGVDLGPALASRGRAAAALRAIQKGLAALAEIPTIERRSLALDAARAGGGRGPGGPGGRRRAARAGAPGHHRGAGGRLRRDCARPFARGATLLAGSTGAAASEGQLGGFAVTVRTPTGDRQVSCGAVRAGLRASSLPPPARRFALRTAGVLPWTSWRRPWPGCRAAAACAPWPWSWTGRLDETKGSTQAALELALKLQKEELAAGAPVLPRRARGGHGAGGALRPGPAGRAWTSSSSKAELGPARRGSGGGHRLPGRDPGRRR